MCRWFSFISGAFHQGLELVQLSGGWLPWLWYRSEALSLFLDAHISWYSHSEIATTIIFFLLDGAKDTALGLPFSLYRQALMHPCNLMLEKIICLLMFDCLPVFFGNSTFVVEQRHGFNKQTLPLFFMDVFKSVGSGTLAHIDERKFAVVGWPSHGPASQCMRLSGTAQ